MFIVHNLPSSLVILGLFHPDSFFIADVTDKIPQFALSPTRPRLSVNKKNPTFIVLVVNKT